MDARMIIGGIITLIVLVGVGIPVIADVVSNSVEGQTATNEAITCANASTVTLDNDELTSTTITLTNGTNTITSGNYSVTAATGKVWFIQYNETKYGSACQVTYGYYDDAYMNSSTARLVTGFVIVFVGIAALLLAAHWTGFI